MEDVFWSGYRGFLGESYSGERVCGVRFLMEGGSFGYSWARLKRIDRCVSFLLCMYMR